MLHNNVAQRIIIDQISKEFAENNKEPVLNYTTLFPPYMFRTINREDRVDTRENNFIKKCQSLNPGYESVLYDPNEDNSLEFVEQYYPEFLDVYKNKFPEKRKGIMRADMLRLLLLHHNGGLYLDMDVECRIPIDTWGESYGIYKEQTSNGTTWFLKNDTKKLRIVQSDRSDNGDMKSREGYADVRNMIQLLIGVEFIGDTPERPRAFTTCAIAARAKHGIFYKAVEMIANKTLLLGWNSTSTNNTKDVDVIKITGPTLWTLAVLQHFIHDGYLANGSEDAIRNATFWQNRQINTLVGDVAILNKQAFGYHQFHANSPPAQSKELYVRHWYKGRWRKE